MNRIDNHRVLILEDHAEQALRLKDSLNNAGYNVVKTGSLEEAQVALEKYDFDVALLDIEILPQQRLKKKTKNENGEYQYDHIPSDIAGIRFAQFLLKEQQIPIVFLTGKDKKTMFNQVLKVIPYAFLDKTGDYPQVAVEYVGMAIAAHSHAKLIENEYYQQFKKGKICIKTDDIYTFIHIDNIQYVTGSGNSMKLYVKGKERPYLFSTEKKKFFTFLRMKFGDTAMQCFVKVHKSHIVNFNYVTGYELGDRAEIHITGREESIVINKDTKQFLGELLPTFGTKPKYKIAVMVGEDMKHHNFDTYININQTPKYEVIEKQLSVVSDNFDMAIIDVESNENGVTGISVVEELNNKGIPVVYICSLDNIDVLKGKSPKSSKLVLKAEEDFGSRLRFAVELLMGRAYDS